jgi:hypothetical protein
MTRRLRLPLVALTVAGVVVAAPAAAHDAA